MRFSYISEPNTLNTHSVHGCSYNNFKGWKKSKIVKSTIINIKVIELMNI